MDTIVVKVGFGLMALVLLVIAGCETHTCRSACTRIYDDCGLEAYLPYKSSESNVDCASPGAWEEHQMGVCSTDCERALYTLTAGGDDDPTTRGLFDEEDAAQFIECVVDSECEDLQRDAHECGIIW